MTQTLPGFSDEPKARLNGAEQSVRFMLAGDAHVTIVSIRTGTRFTYRVAAPKQGPSAAVRFVSVLTSPDTYTFLGTIFIQQQNRFAHSMKSPIGPDAPSVKAFAWVWRHLSTGIMPAQIEMWHEGKCGRCGRRLTTPTSIATGMGPECSKKL
jgi:hypothetical protein